MHLIPDPPQAFLDQKFRRTTIPYQARLHALLSQGAEEDLAILAAFANGAGAYPDVMRHTVRRLVEGFLDAETEAFTLAKLLIGVCAPPAEGESEWMITDLQDLLDRPELAFAVRRGVAKALASAGLHPACQLPIPVRRVGDLWVMRYLLTTGLVAEVSNTVRPTSPARPYVLQGVTDAWRVTEAISAATRERWRLPSMEEWEVIAGPADRQPWPWGDEPPKRQVHAHLSFNGAPAPDHEIEVGLFPAGASSAGVLDVIGNLYELVGPGRNFPVTDHRLVGGSWDSRPKGQRPEPLKLRSPKANTGLRLVRDVDES